METALEILLWSLPTVIPFVIGGALTGFLVWSRMSAKLDSRAREMSRTVAQAPRLVPVQRTVRAQPHDQDATVVMNVIRPEETQ